MERWDGEIAKREEKAERNKGGEKGEKGAAPSARGRCKIGIGSSEMDVM